ncbi:MAG: hypothetical protein WCR06_05460 [bacterium]
MREIPPGYRMEQGVVAIDLRLNRAAQLFNTFDPAPFHERDLDDDAEAYIVACAREITHRNRFKLVVHLPPEEAARENAGQLEKSVNHYFLYRAQGQRRELRQAFRHGRWSLLVGLTTLVSCLGLRALIMLVDPQLSKLISEIASEGLLIVGWVAMWRPAEQFLYAWHPTRQTLLVYRNLSCVKVEIRARADPAGTV